MKDIKKLDFVTDNYRIFSDDEDDDDMEDDDKARYVEIEMFRTGIFEHRYYGRLQIDKKYLQTMYNNWKKRVHTTQVSFDLDHDHTSGATAWLPNYSDKPDALKIKKKTYKDSEGRERMCHVLVATAELTELGYKALKSKKYRYFSSEIDPNFVPYERFYEQDADGQIKEEEVKEYGPTIKGGAFTNFPFIIGMEPISLSFSNTGEFRDQEIYKDSFAGASGDDRLMIFSSKAEEKEVVYSDDIDPDNVENKSEYTNNTNRSEAVLPTDSANSVKLNEKQESLMNLSEILASLSGKSNKEKTQLLQAATLSFSDNSNERVVLNALLQTELALAEKEALVQTEMQKRLAREQEVESLKLSNLELAQKAEENKQLAYSQRVQVFCQDLEKKNHHQSVINAVNGFLTRLSAPQRDLKFSVLSADMKETAEVDLFSMISDILEALPEDARFSDKETLAASGSGAQTQETPAQTPAPEQKKLDKFDLFFNANPGYVETVDELRLDPRWDEVIDADGKLIPFKSDAQ